MSAFLLPLLLPAAFPQTEAPAVAAAPAPKKVKPICRTEEVTGSIMGKRVCHSAAEWKQIEDANQAATEAFRNRSPTRGGGMGN